MRPRRITAIDLRDDMDFQITAEDVKEALDRGEKLTLVDVREPWEFEVSHLEGAKLIPIGDIIRRMDEIDPAKDTVLHCKMGGRSAQAIQMLRQAGFTGPLRNLRGGITAWSNEVDPKVPKY